MLTASKDQIIKVLYFIIISHWIAGLSVDFSVIIYLAHAVSASLGKL